MGKGLLYDVENPMDKAMQGLQAASNTARSFDKKEQVYTPPKTAGGAIGSGMSGAGSGALLGTAVSAINPIAGAVAGGALGLISYFLS